MESIDDDYENFLNNNYNLNTIINKKQNLEPLFSELYISTKTIICYLNKEIDIYNIFWKIKLINYNDFKEGILKKQIKISCTDEQEVEKINNYIDNEKNNTINVINLSKISDPHGRTKFKDIRKISIGISKKDLINSRIKEKSAFYNCFVLVLRILFEDKYKEIHVKIFNTGKLEIPGIQKEKMLNIVLSHIKFYMKNFYNDIDYKNNFETVLINSNFNCGFYLDRDKLFNILRFKYKINSCYDPCSYPGIQSHFYYDINENINNQNGLQKNDIKQVKISFMIFRTGSILIVGKCEEETIYYIYEFVKNILYNEFNSICKEINNNKKEILNKKTKKKIITFIE